MRMFERPEQPAPDGWDTTVALSLRLRINTTYSAESVSPYPLQRLKMPGTRDDEASAENFKQRPPKTSKPSTFAFEYLETMFNDSIFI